MNIATLTKQIRAHGGEVIDVRETGSGHLRWRIKGPKGIFIVFASNTPSCHHGRKNFIADVKRGLRNGRV